MSSAADTVEYPYRAISRAAIASVIFFALALPAVMPTFSPLLGLALVGAIAAGAGLSAIRRYPDEYSGRSLALFGLIGNLVLFAGGIAEHTYIYLTEVPDGYERVQFYQLQQDPALPDGPTDAALEISGEPVFLKGYIHPSSGGGMLRQFVLVPDLGTCCFGGQPRSSDMIEVTLTSGQTVRAGLFKRKLAGTFIVTPYPQKKTDFDNTVFYRMKADQVR